MKMFTKFQVDIFNSRTPAALRTRRRILLSSTVHDLNRSSIDCLTPELSLNPLNPWNMLFWLRLNNIFIFQTNMIYFRNRFELKNQGVTSKRFFSEIKGSSWNYVALTREKTRYSKISSKNYIFDRHQRSKEVKFPQNVIYFQKLSGSSETWTARTKWQREFESSFDGLPKPSYRFWA